MSDENKRINPTERRLKDERRIGGMVGGNLAAMGHELADKPVEPPPGQATKPKRKRRKQAAPIAGKRQKLEEAERASRREEAELVANPSGDKAHPTDH